MVLIAEAYIDAVNRADLDGLLSLFAADPVLLHPAGRFEGREAISGFYTDVVFHGQAVTEIERIHVTDDAQVLQLRATSPLAEPGQYVYAVDVFGISDGLIRTLDIYYR
jgi:ketosteroid isomerase-like protein